MFASDKFISILKSRRWWLKEINTNEASGEKKVHILKPLEAHPLVGLGRTCLLKQEQEGYFAFL
jgi:hypothetical protein